MYNSEKRFIKNRKTKASKASKIYRFRPRIKGWIKDYTFSKSMDKIFAQAMYEITYQ